MTVIIISKRHYCRHFGSINTSQTEVLVPNEIPTQKQITKKVYETIIKTLIQVCITKTRY